MALNVKNRQVERLAAEVARLTGETRTEAVRQALEERKARLAMRGVRKDRRADILRFLERDVWSLVPRGHAGRPLTRKEEDDILGYRRGGV